MSRFHFDISKFNTAFDITNGNETVTVHSTKHAVETCGCNNCRTIMAHRKPAQPAKESWTYKYTYTPPAPAAPPPPMYAAPPPPQPPP
ncbi:hypothetical protein GGF43_005638, partial [Coemansia sp. RSA 2618]